MLNNFSLFIRSLSSEFCIIDLIRVLVDTVCLGSNIHSIYCSELASARAENPGGRVTEK